MANENISPVNHVVEKLDADKSGASRTRESVPFNGWQSENGLRAGVFGFLTGGAGHTCESTSRDESTDVMYSISL